MPSNKYNVRPTKAQLRELHRIDSEARQARSVARRIKPVSEVSGRLSVGRVFSEESTDALDRVVRTLRGRWVATPGLIYTRFTGALIERYDPKRDPRSLDNLLEDAHLEASMAKMPAKDLPTVTLTSSVSGPDSLLSIIFSDPALPEGGSLMANELIAFDEVNGGRKAIVNRLRERDPELPSPHLHAVICRLGHQREPNLADPKVTELIPPTISFDAVRLFN